MTEKNRPAIQRATGRLIYTVTGRLESGEEYGVTFSAPEDATPELDVARAVIRNRFGADPETLNIEAEPEWEDV